MGGVLTKVFDDDLGLLGKVRRVERHKSSNGSLSASPIVLGVVLDCFLDLPKSLVRGVVGEDIKDESLVNGLTH